MYRIKYISPEGKEWGLSTESHQGVFLIEGGLDGLVGSSGDSVTTSTLLTGQRFHGVHTEPMTGSLTCQIAPLSGDKVSDVMRRFRGAWSRHVPGTLIIEDDDLGIFRANVRLSESIAAPFKQPDDNSSIECVIPLIADEGVWLFRHDSKTDKDGVVKVKNWGDTQLTVRISWKGSGGQVTLPSGATFTLPETSEERILWLDNNKSLMVTDVDEKIDRELWKTVSYQALAETVPMGEEKVFKIPDGAVLIWDVATFDPWR